MTRPHLSDTELLARLVFFDTTSRRSNRPLAEWLCDYLDRPGVTIVRDLAPDGLFLSNGPGDPDAVSGAISVVGELAKELPTFGICLGHQILSLALGAKTYKMKFGHHGGNQPVLDVDTGVVEITSQNHGFAVDVDSLPSTWRSWFINLNDGTSEGVRHDRAPFRSVQFHPEAAPGPVDTAFLFDDFADTLRS